MNIFLEDILSQPVELVNALDFYNSKEMVEKFKKAALPHFSKVIFSGMGSSHYCAIGASLYLRQQGIESEVISTGELLYYEKMMLTEDTLICLISQSGESGELVHLMKSLPQNRQVIVITNDKNSTLGKRGDIVFELQVSQEESVSTRTYIASMMLSYLLAAYLGNQDAKEMILAMQELIGGMKRYLLEYWSEMGKMESFAEKLVSPCFIGRGYSLGTLQASVLFFGEAIRLSSSWYDSAEFRHGPMEMVDENFSAVIFAQHGETQQLNLNLAVDIAQKGGKVLLITDTTADKLIYQEYDNITVILIPLINECFSPLLQILPIQLLIAVTALKNNLPLGEFRWGGKVTLAE